MGDMAVNIGVNEVEKVNEVEHGGTPLHPSIVCWIKEWLDCWKEPISEEGFVCLTEEICLRDRTNSIKIIFQWK